MAHAQHLGVVPFVFDTGAIANQSTAAETGGELHAEPKLGRCVPGVGQTESLRKLD